MATPIDHNLEAYRAEYPDADDLLLRAYMAEDVRVRKAKAEAVLWEAEFWRDNKHWIWCAECASCDRWKDPHPCTLSQADRDRLMAGGITDSVHDWTIFHGCKYQKDADGGEEYHRNMEPKMTWCPMREMLIEYDGCEPGETGYEKGEGLEDK